MTRKRNIAITIAIAVAVIALMIFLPVITSSKNDALGAAEVAFDYGSNYPYKTSSIYEHGHRNPAFKKTILKKIDEMEASNNLGKLCYASAYLDSWGYKNAKVRSAFKQSILNVLQKDKNNYVANVATICSRLEPNSFSFKGVYYNDAFDYVDTASFVSNSSEICKAVLEANDVDAFIQYAEDITDISKCMNFSTNDIFPYEETVDFLKRNCYSAIYKDGVGGYYDNLKAEYSNRGSTDKNGNSSATSYEFFGDFLRSNYTKRYSRPTGEAWEESLLSKYDINGIELYFKNKKVSWGHEYDSLFNNNDLLGIYEYEGTFFIVLDGNYKKIVSFYDIELKY